MKPLVLDLFCGLGGFTEGFLAEGWDAVGVDIERHDYGSGGYPARLILMDALEIDGAEFCNVDCIVASPPCQELNPNWVEVIRKADEKLATETPKC